MKRISLALLAILLGGCAKGLSPALFLAHQDGATNCAALDQEQQLSMRMVSEMVDQGRHHAALAHLALLPEQHPAVRLRQARVMRSLKLTGAREKFASLNRTCMHAYGEQGLGLIAADQGDTAQALVHLRKAALQAPIEASIRSDLGWISMSAGDLNAARFELLTALELAPDDRRITSNVLTLLYLQNQDAEAEAMATRLGLPAEQSRQAQQQAQKLRATPQPRLRHEPAAAQASIRIERPLQTLSSQR